MVTRFRDWAVSPSTQTCSKSTFTIDLNQRIWLFGIHCCTNLKNSSGDIGIILCPITMWSFQLSGDLRVAAMDLQGNVKNCLDSMLLVEGLLGLISVPLTHKDCTCRKHLQNLLTCRLLDPQKDAGSAGGGGAWVHFHQSPRDLRMLTWDPTVRTTDPHAKYQLSAFMHRCKIWGSMSFPTVSTAET